MPLPPAEGRGVYERGGLVVRLDQALQLQAAEDRKQLSCYRRLLAACRRLHVQDVHALLKNNGFTGIGNGIETVALNMSHSQL